MNNQELQYVYTRLGVEGVANVYLANSIPKSVLEIKKTQLVLDNEKLGRDISIDLNLSDYNVLEKYFLTLHGKKLDNIDIDNLNVLCCREIPMLEDELVFVTIEETSKGEDIMYTITITDKHTGKSNSVELSKEVYVALVNYCRR